jgi:hypothetical protein
LALIFVEEELSDLKGSFIISVGALIDRYAGPVHRVEASLLGEADVAFIVEVGLQLYPHLDKVALLDLGKVLLLGKNIPRLHD